MKLFGRCAIIESRFVSVAVSRRHRQAKRPNIMYARSRQIAERCPMTNRDPPPPPPPPPPPQTALCRCDARRHVAAPETLLIGAASRISELEKRLAPTSDRPHVCTNRPSRLVPPGRSSGTPASREFASERTREREREREREMRGSHE